MELPPALRQAVDAALHGVSTRDLAAASEVLSRRYRGEVRDGRSHISDDLTARAYLAARLPATYAAIRAVLDAVAGARPEFTPSGLLDFGAGPGTVLWAVRDRWPTLRDARLIEASAAIRHWGERLAAESEVPKPEWRSTLDESDPHDLVTAAYVLDELEPDARVALLRRLWDATRGILLIVEPGTPAGWQRMLSARNLLIASGAHLVAPCPHAASCPLKEPDWCHFAQRVARSRTHLQTKGAEVPWEDEKFIYIAAAREPAPASYSERVIAPPRRGSGKVELKLCRSDGSAGSELVTRRNGARFKTARRADWGDAL